MRELDRTGGAGLGPQERQVRATPEEEALLKYVVVVKPPDYF